MTRTLVLVLLLFTSSIHAAETISIHRIDQPIVIDGALDEAAWSAAAPVERWFEISPGDNVEPKVKSVGWLAYDDRAFYAGFRFSDSDPKAIRAPYVDRDRITTALDYGGIIVDTRNDGRSAMIFYGNPRGIQYDALTHDATGESSAPDFHWESAARIGSDGWTLEMRIPFSSLRYAERDPQVWGIMLFRNYPRDRRYQLNTSRVPRASTCFVCNAATLTGLASLPQTWNVVATPYATARSTALRETSFGDGERDVDGGLDVKWTPTAHSAIDLTLNPDFSQVEADAPVITANERFAISYPEKRPFFLEGFDLFNTLVAAVNTRSITSPTWGVRATGRRGNTAYTALVARDDGGGRVILPGVQGSRFALQDFQSTAAVARVRHDVGRAFFGFLFTDRESEGGASNRVAGPDFQWRPRKREVFTGQLLLSHSETPNRPDLAAEWNGQSLTSYAARLNYNYVSDRGDISIGYFDYGDEFRADLGFVPQVGYRAVHSHWGLTHRPRGFFSFVHPYVNARYTADQDGEQQSSAITPGLGLEGKWGTFATLIYEPEKIRAGSRLFSRERISYSIGAAPGRVLSSISLQGWIGSDVDFFTNSRTGDGMNTALEAVVRPSDRLELRISTGYRALDVEPTGHRLFTARYHRLRAQHAFNARSFVRAVVEQSRDEVNLTGAANARRRSGALNASLLYAYKLSWQTVLFVGYGDQQALVDATNDYRSQARDLFIKVSYALQR